MAEASRREATELLYTAGRMQEAARWLATERYEVGEVVGRGGYGMVCRGLDRKTGQAVALKMLSPEAGKDPDVVERMLREQQALVALSGTCAVTAIDLCRLESGAPMLVMEWLEGCDLEQQLSAWESTGHRPGPDNLLTVLHPLTQTLERAHEIGIVHRDIKPANIFLTLDDHPGVRLLDFGLSRMKSAAPLTAVGMVMGSPSYIAPETWRGNSQALDGRADLFALAVIVFRWLTGKLPFDAPDLIGKMTAVTSGPRPSARAVRPDLPAQVDAWFARALAVEASDRFQTASNFYDALAAALRGEALPDTSGIRHVDAVPAPERKSVLAGAWQAAASLLKRFTAPKVTPSAPPPPAVPVAPAVFVSEPPPPVAEPVAEDPSSGDRKTVWLDSEELEDAETVAPGTEPAPHIEPSPEPPPAEESPAPALAPAPAPAKAKKPKKKSKAKTKAAKKPSKRGKKKRKR